MSYILDALKKSEEERQQNTVPTVYSIYSSARRGNKKSHSLLIKPLLLSIALIGISLVFSVYYFNGKSTAIFFGSTFLDAIKNFDNEVDINLVDPIDKAVDLGVVKESKKEILVEDGSVDQLTPVVSTESKISNNEVAEVEALPLMSVNELPDDVRRSVPSMNFSFHIYSNDKNKSTVVIDGKRYREGDLIEKNWFLDMITESGIIIRKDQYRAAVEVVEGW